MVVFQNINGSNVDDFFECFMKDNCYVFSKIKKLYLKKRFLPQFITKLDLNMKIKITSLY